MLAAELVLLALVVVAATSLVWSTLRLGISPMPSSAAARREVLALVPAELEGELHELGAGWGGLAFALARHCPRATVVAWEASWVPYLFLRARRALFPAPNLVLRRGDFFAAPLSGARAVVCYLWTGAMARLAVTLAEQLPPGALVVSHTFALPGWTPEETRRAADLYRSPVYRYLAPGPQPSQRTR